MECINYLTIKNAKNGDNEAIDKILKFYLKKIKKFSSDDEFVQTALIEVFKGISKFENKKSKKIF